MSNTGDLRARSDLGGLVGLDAHRREPDSSSQLNGAVIPEMPTLPAMSLHPINVWTQDQNHAANRRRKGGSDAALFRKKNNNFPTVKLFNAQNPSQYFAFPLHYKLGKEKTLFYVFIYILT